MNLIISQILAIQALELLYLEKKLKDKSYMWQFVEQA